ncbi:MAG: hypothetical protein WBM99_02930 [Psychromonas sp.]
MENSTICIIDLKSNTAYALVSRQNIDIEGATRVEQYAQHVINVATNLRKLNLNYLAADAYYSKVKLLIYSGCTKVTGVDLLNRRNIYFISVGYRVF